MTLDDCVLIGLPRITNPQGNLTVAEGGAQVPFAIARVYYLTDVPGGAERGGHAHRALTQLIIAVAGSFSVHLDDGAARRTVRLDRSDRGLLVGPMIWREIDGFTPSAVCLVLASAPYDAADYYRDYPEFQAAAGQRPV